MAVECLEKIISKHDIMELSNKPYYDQYISKNGLILKVSDKMNTEYIIINIEGRYEHIIFISRKDFEQIKKLYY